MWLMESEDLSKYVVMRVSLLYAVVAVVAA